MRNAPPSRRLVRLRASGKRLAPLFGLLASAGIADAEGCLTTEDALKGIEVLYSDGARSVIIRAPDGSVTEVEDVGEGTLYTYLADNGFLESGYFEGKDGKRDRFTYTFDVDLHAPPEPWQGQRGEQITTDESGVELNRVPFSWMTRGAGRKEYDRCAYDVIPIQTTYHNPDGATMVEFVWLADLQIPLNVGYYDASGPSVRLPLSLQVMGE